ncbi:hypothetical protein [Haloarchaeobius sp. DYHT-AS-18]|uniref:hypothetical protein n=1 Tax=Haloarchaeobius sp. DYHT-AS-18 TaxID=3446117 RepID=UPI003EBFE3F1
MKRPLLALTLALMLLVAGCNTATQDTSTTVEGTEAATSTATTVQPTTTATQTPTATQTTTPEPAAEDCEFSGQGDDDIVQESGVCLGFDADQVYRNILEMTGSNVTQGPSIQSKSPEQTTPYTFDQFGFSNQSFQAVMGIAPEGTPSVYVAGYAQPQMNPDGGVEVNVVMRYIAKQDGSPAPGRTQNASEAEVTAAHEFLHAVQFYQGSQDRLASNLRSDGVNLANVETSLIEGSAVYFESEYQEQYMGKEAASRSVEQWANSSAFSMYTLGPYVMGERYTKFRVNSTAEFEKLYDNPAVTMEQIMHNKMPDEDLPKELTVEQGSDSVWNQYSKSTKGELFLRSSLRAEVSGELAAAGAEGWGADRVMQFQNTSYAESYKYGYGWTVRFDNASEKDEFVDVYQQWLDNRGTEQNGVYAMDEAHNYRMVDIDSETVVILAGHENFVTQATATGNNTHVTITMTDSKQVGSVQADDDGEDNRVVVDQQAATRVVA